MDILITGANGQLGYDCTAILKTSHNVTDVYHDDVDITHIDEIRRIFKRNKFDIIINCAAYTKVDDSEHNYCTAWNVNVNGIKNLAVVSNENKCKLIHISTDYVFDGSRSVPTPYIESDLTNPISYYGSSKLQGEKILDIVMSNYIILRTSWVYGTHGDNILKKIVNKINNNPNETIKVVNDQYGTPTWTYSIGKQVEHIINYNKNITGLFHCSSEGYCTWYEFVCYYLDKMNIKCDITPCDTNEYPTVARRPKNSILENRRLKKLGINIMKDWKEDVDEFVKL